MRYAPASNAFAMRSAIEEWQDRINLAAASRLVDLYGMTDLIDNHITVRIPGTGHLVISL
jgi:ribulose-5-phosphate 4-epimerase/fuculose-1-phosphate aldolase